MKGMISETSSMNVIEVRKNEKGCEGFMEKGSRRTVITVVLLQGDFSQNISPENFCIGKKMHT
jgi:hypothetical protein